MPGRAARRDRRDFSRRERQAAGPGVGESHGCWRARCKGPDDIDRPASKTFASKADAERWLALTEAEIIRGDWLDPDAGRVPFDQYAVAWVNERPNLRPKTLQLYGGLLRLRYAQAGSHVSAGSAPSATRTRDLLLRRQLLYPLSYRGRPGQGQNLLAGPKPNRSAAIPPLTEARC
jgi:hypothetical protein